MKLYTVSTIIIFLLFSGFTDSKAQRENATLWKIERHNNANASYLFGTIHSQDKRVFMLDSAIITYIKKCQLFVTEMDAGKEVEDSDLAKFLLPNEKYLKDLYTNEEYNTIKEAFEAQSSQKLDDLNNLHPFALFKFLQTKSVYALPLNLDEFLNHEARISDKEIYALESLKDQITYSKEAFNARAIYNYFKNTGLQDSLKSELRKAYISEDANKLMNITFNNYEHLGVNTDILFKQRNIKMVEKIDSIIQTKSAFIAVGAGHLYEESGIIKRLEQRGYKLTPIHNKKIMHQPIHFKIDWKRYESFNDNFTAIFPVDPEIIKKTSQNIYTCDLLRNGVPSMTFTIIENINPKYRPMDSDVMTRMMLSQIESNYSKSLSLKTESKSHVIQEESIALDAVESFRNNTNLMHSRFIIRPGKLYILNVLCKPNTEDLDIIKNFMNSLSFKVQ